MWFLLGTTLTASFFDSLNPSAIAQQMLLQAMVKKKRHIWFFICGIGTANLIMGLAIYYGIATWVSKFLTKIVNAYPLYVYGAAAIGGIVLLGAGIRLIIKTRQSNAEKNNNGCEETENVKAPAQLSPVSLFIMGAAFCMVELTSAFPYFGFLALLTSYHLIFPLALLFMLIYLKKKKLFAFKISAFDKNEVLSLIQKAIPSVIQQSIPAISTTSLTALVSTYSVTAIAAYGVTGKLETILFYPAMALNMVLTTIIGQCIGGARYDRAKDYLKCALEYGCGLLVVLSILVVGFSRQLSGTFVKSDGVATIVGTYFLIVSIGYVLNTVTNCYLGTLNGMGNPSKSMFLMIFYYIVVRIPLAYLLSYLGFGLNGIWTAVLVSHVVASIAAAITGTIFVKKKESAEK